MQEKVQISEAEITEREEKKRLEDVQSVVASKEVEA